MARLADIKKSINKTLKTKFPEIKIYANEITEGFKRPCFFTQILPVTMDYDGVNVTSNQIMVVINYFSELRPELNISGKGIDNLQMHDEIKEALGMTLEMGRRSLLLQNIRHDIVDGVLQFKFDLNFFVDIEKSDLREDMMDLEIEIIKE